MMNAIEKLLKRIKIWKRRICMGEINLLRDNMREKFDHEILEHLDCNDFNDMVDVARYAEMGIFTVIQAAFCMGYQAGKQELSKTILEYFGKNEKKS